MTFYNLMQELSKKISFILPIFLNILAVAGLICICTGMPLMSISWLLYAFPLMILLDILMPFASQAWVDHNWDNLSSLYVTSFLGAFIFYCFGVPPTFIVNLPYVCAFMILHATIVCQYPMFEIQEALERMRIIFVMAALYQIMSLCTGLPARIIPALPMISAILVLSFSLMPLTVARTFRILVDMMANPAPMSLKSFCLLMIFAAAFAVKLQIFPLISSLSVLPNAPLWTILGFLVCCHALLLTVSFLGRLSDSLLALIFECSSRNRNVEQVVGLSRDGTGVKVKTAMICQSDVAGDSISNEISTKPLI